MALFAVNLAYAAFYFFGVVLSGFFIWSGLSMSRIESLILVTSPIPLYFMKNHEFRWSALVNAGIILIDAHIAWSFLDLILHPPPLTHL